MNFPFLEAMVYLAMIGLGFFLTKHGETFLNTMSGPRGSLKHTLVTLNPTLIGSLIPGFTRFASNLTKPLLIIGGIFLIIIGTIRLIITIAKTLA